MLQDTKASGFNPTCFGYRKELNKRLTPTETTAKGSQV